MSKRGLARPGGVGPGMRVIQDINSDPDDTIR
jgi:hypothetical protein